MTETKGTWGGKREGAGRRPSAADGLPRKMCSMRASVEEWELIKKFAKLLKDDPERAKNFFKEYDKEKEIPASNDNSTNMVEVVVELPAYLAVLAEERGIDLSSVLQKALLDKIRK